MTFTPAILPTSSSTQYFAAFLHYLRDKPTAFCAIDTHAGSGVYNLAGEKALRGGEWQDGIGKLMAAKIPEATATLLSPCLEVVRALNDRNRLRVYPGSPALARAWLRAQDRLIAACELGPKASSLSHNSQGDARIKILRIDGWTAMNAYEPPRERRGLVLVDPSFEADSDFPRLASGLAAAHRKWATGIYILWYPIKGRRQEDVFAKQVRRLAITALRAELFVGPPSDQNRPNGAGLVIVNPPLDTGKPAFGSVTGPERHPEPRKRGRFSARLAYRQSPGSRRLHGLFPQPRSWCVVPTLAVTFRLLWGPAE